MIDLTDTDIAQLNDEDLRELVVRLCEAELRENGLPVSWLTAGGNQNATDGGIDVRVSAPVAIGLDFISRSSTGFQVKCEDTPASKIAAEMMPNGQLRESIAELVATRGAYIIVCSKGSVSDKPLRMRLEAMRAAIKHLPGAANAAVDFYDRVRLVRWVRGYLGVEMWIRRRIGKPLSGWEGFDTWAGDAGASPYLKDGVGRLISKSAGSPEPMPVDRGIDALRERLRKPGGVARLVGLSGVGKTRLVQALFESGVGAEPLDAAIAIYSDLGNSPQPSPGDLMQQLGANGRRAIVVVDNCNPDTHRSLTQIVSSHSSTLSLITVEFDITDDESEATQFFELTGSSENVLEQILAKLAPQVQESDRRQLVEFAGGNARVALALARTVQNGETLGVLKDEQLFKRLFIQNQAPNDTLFRAGEACSLVYSFDGEAIDSDAAELPVLASLVGLTPQELFRQVAELKRRDLIQSRSKWRAVLPHALANRLAKQALSRIPGIIVRETFAKHERLLRSFSRRIGFLHDSAEARSIAEHWFRDSGWLANPATLSELGKTLFWNLAPLVPAMALEALVTAVTGDKAADFNAASAGSRNRWVSLAHNLAYECEHFEQAARIVLAFAEAEGSSDRWSKDIWKSLFYAFWSGSKAPPEQRVALLKELLSNGTTQQQQIALVGLEGMLETVNFMSTHEFSFGARPRGHDWKPQSEKDFKDWYRSAFALVEVLAVDGSPHRRSVRALLAKFFRPLWGNVEMQGELSALALSLAGTEGWAEGWVATKLTRQYDGSAMSPDRLGMLKDLEQALRPATLKQKVQAYVCAPSRLDLYDADSDRDNAQNLSEVAFEKTRERLNAEVERLANEVARDGPLLRELLPDLLSGGSGHQYEFGRALAIASADLRGQWKQIRTGFENLDVSNRNLATMAGFLNGATRVDATSANEFLDSAVVDPLLAPYFPILQGDTTSDERGRRLLAALKHGAASSSTYYQPSYRLRDGKLSVAVYREILETLSGISGGLHVAITLLDWTLDEYFRAKEVPEPGLIEAGRALLKLFNFDIIDNMLPHRLDGLAAACLQGPDAVSTAAVFCSRFAEALRDHNLAADSYEELACTLFKVQPAAAAGAFLGQKTNGLGRALLARLGNSAKNPVNCADSAALLAWAREDLHVRAPLLAADIDILPLTPGPSTTLSTVAAEILAIAPNKQAVLDSFATRFYPRAWTGSLAAILAPYRVLVERLSTDPDLTVANWACQQLVEIDERLSVESRGTYQRQVDEKFE